MIRILIIPPTKLSELIATLTVLDRLPPDSEITLLLPRTFADISQRVPRVHHTIVLPYADDERALISRRRFGQSLRGQFDRVYILAQNFTAALIPFFAKIPERIGYLTNKRGALLTKTQANPQQILNSANYYAKLFNAQQEAAQPITTPTTNIRVTPQNADRTASTLKLKRTDQAIAVLCPGAAYGSSKRWPAHYFADLAARLSNQGYQCWLVGDDQDRCIANNISRLADCIDLCGQTNLAEVSDLLTLAQIVISNDSALMHLALALNCPTVVTLSGATTLPESIHPLLNPQSTVCYQKLDCAPCFKSQCPKYTHPKCLTDISPQKVLQAALRYSRQR